MGNRATPALSPYASEQPIEVHFWRLYETVASNKLIRTASYILPW